MLRLHDTALLARRELQPRSPGVVSVYLCGPTVDGPPHVGHGRMALVWDVLRRYLEWRGHRVRFVSNITDIDDKIINRAAEEGRATEEVAAEFEAVWYETMDALGVRRPDEDPHATAYVAEMVELIARLVDDGAAYETADGVYFSAEAVADYGLLAHQSLADMRAGERVAMVEDKRAPADFSLWKKAKPDEPTWPSPWGPGRPGWHTECVVMSLGLLGDDFDIHGGGVDLVFPHHENERAQAVAAGHRFARHWVHSGHVTAGGGEKMSKSLGNVMSLPDLVASVDPRAYRLLVLQSHYRSPMEVSSDALRAAEVALRRVDGLARLVAESPVTATVAAAADEAVLDRFRALMDDDLATPSALGVVFDAINQAHGAASRGDHATAASLGAAVLDMLAAVGLYPRVSGEALPPEVASLMAERDRARAARDWARADEIRGELTARGWVVEDGASGTRVRQ